MRRWRVRRRGDDARSVWFQFGLPIEVPGSNLSVTVYGGAAVVLIRRLGEPRVKPPRGDEGKRSAKLRPALRRSSRVGGVSRTARR